MTELHDVVAWSRTASLHDLFDASNAINTALETKKNEGRVSLLRVETDGVVVAHFRNGQHEEALRYLLAHSAEVDGVHIHTVRIHESEVDAHLAERWWKDKGAPQ